MDFLILILLILCLSFAYILFCIATGPSSKFEQNELKKFKIIKQFNSTCDIIS